MALVTDIITSMDFKDIQDDVLKKISGTLIGFFLEMGSNALIFVYRCIKHDNFLSVVHLLLNCKIFTLFVFRKYLSYKDQKRDCIFKPPKRSLLFLTLQGDKIIEHCYVNRSYSSVSLTILSLTP